MSSTVTHLEGLRYKLNVVVPAEEAGKLYQQHLAKAASNIKLDGFRPGKVPQKVVEKQFGSQLRQEVCQQLVQTGLTSAVEEHDLKVAGMPDVQPSELLQGVDYTFDATVEVYPELDVQDLDDVNITHLSASIVEEDVDGMIENIRKQNTTWETVDRAAQEGDQVKIDFEGFLDNLPFEGGASEGFLLELGSKQMISGFESGIVGMSTNEEKDIEVAFPEEYGVKDLAGKKARFHITCHEVNAGTLPEMDAAFFEKLGGESLEAVKETIKTHMEGELSRVVEDKNKAKTLEVLLEHNEFEVPMTLVDTEIKNLHKMALQQLAARQGQQQLPKIDLPREPYEEEAIKRVKLGLILADVLQKKEIKVDAARVRDKVEQIAANYDSSEEVVQQYFQNKKLLSEIESAVLEEQVIESMLERAIITAEEATYDELLKEK